MLSFIVKMARLPRFALFLSGAMAAVGFLAVADGRFTAAAGYGTASLLMFFYSNVAD